MDFLLATCEEFEDEITAQVNGTIPGWLNVDLLRVGPAKWDLDDDFSLNHWLDGCAMLCKFTICRGCVKFRSKFLRSDSYNKMIKVKRPVYTEFGTRAFPDPCKNVFSRLLSQIVPSDLTDNGCIGIYKLSDEYFAATETCNILKVCQHSLNVQRKINLDKIVNVNLACSHVQYIDQEDYAYNMSSSFLTGMKYHLLKIPMFNDSKEQSRMDGTTILSTIPSNWKTCLAYYHSFGVTKNYIIFLELPLLVNGFKLATCTPKGKPLKDCFEWHPNEKTRFYVICKRTGQVVLQCISRAFFYFHTINSYEDEGHIVTDLMAYDDASILDKWDLGKLRKNIYDENNQAIPTRFVIPLRTDLAEAGQNLVSLPNTKATAVLREGLLQLTGEEIGKPGFELPTINYKRCNGRKYKFCYGSGVFERGNFANSICKLNVQDKTVISWKESNSLYPGECIFIPRPGGVEEDDGVLLSVVLSSNETDPHFLLILDAKDFKEIARAHLISGRGSLPPTIHGVYTYHDEEKKD